MSERGLAEWLRAWFAGGPLRSTLWAIKSYWRALRGMTGAFRVAADSDEALRLTRLWDSRWAGGEPVGHELRHRYAERSVRFHTLPGSKQYADRDQEYAEILRRHRVLLEELSDGAAVGTLVVIGADYGRRDAASGWVKREMADAWPWRRYDDPDDDISVFFWVTSGIRWARLDDLLRRVADEQADLVISNADLDWLYHPYDGGADVVLPTSQDRDSLRNKHTEWLPV